MTPIPGAEMRALFDKDWGDGLRLMEITEWPWERRYRLHFVTKDAAKFSLLLDPSTALLRSSLLPTAETIIADALAALA